MGERRPNQRKKLSIEIHPDLLTEVDRIGAHWHWSRARTIEILLRQRLRPSEERLRLVATEPSVLGTLEDSPPLDTAAPGSVDDYERGQPLSGSSGGSRAASAADDCELFV